MRTAEDGSAAVHGACFRCLLGLVLVGCSKSKRSSSTARMAIDKKAHCT